ncbi:small integral membrane protein 47 isoform X3 [Pseudorca crassidens]|uniref:small integral membrane protein 47 isoform X3 n=1 Tax=Pseudorca crassidens TaxID=82174 RepID=UPI00352DE1C0
MGYELQENATLAIAVFTILTSIYFFNKSDKGENLGPVGPRRPWQGQPEIKDANGICKLQSQKLVSPALAGKSISAKQEFRDLSRDGDREIQAQLTVTSKVLSLNPDPDTLTPAGTPVTRTTPFT